MNFVKQLLIFNSANSGNLFCLYLLDNSILLTGNHLISIIRMHRQITVNGIPQQLGKAVGIRLSVQINRHRPALLQHHAGHLIQTETLILATGHPQVAITAPTWPHHLITIQGINQRLQLDPAGLADIVQDIADALAGRLCLGGFTVLPCRWQAASGQLLGQGAGLGRITSIPRFFLLVKLEASGGKPLNNLIIRPAWKAQVDIAALVAAQGRAPGHRGGGGRGSRFRGLLLGGHRCSSSSGNSDRGGRTIPRNSRSSQRLLGIK